MSDLNREFLESYMNSKLKALDNHVHAMDTNFEKSFLQLLKLEAKIELLEEIMDDFSMTSRGRRQVEPAGITDHL
jgi:hypothetical protein